MIAGIDLAGTVTASDHPDWHPGDVALATGWGLGETHPGGYAPQARLFAAQLTRLPAGLDARMAMALGTAGLTAMLSVLALERHGLSPADGPALITGAAGGVGSVAVALLARAGWHVIASTGRAAEAGFLAALGAAEVIDRAETSVSGKPLEKERWAAAIDVAGGATLAGVLARTRSGGAVAACGLAAGMELPITVAPFILRGVALLGIDSVQCPAPLREAAWSRLATDLDQALLQTVTQEITLAEVPEWAERILEGGVRGRVVIRLN